MVVKSKACQERDEAKSSTLNPLFQQKHTGPEYVQPSLLDPVVEHVIIVCGFLDDGIIILILVPPWKINVKVMTKMQNMNDFTAEQSKHKRSKWAPAFRVSTQTVWLKYRTMWFGPVSPCSGIPDERAPWWETAPLLTLTSSPPCLSEDTFGWCVWTFLWPYFLHVWYNCFFVPSEK